MRNRLDSLFPPFGLLGDLEREFRSASHAVRSGAPVNVRHDENQAVATFELPGYDADAIDLEVEGRELTLTARREPVVVDGEESPNWVLRERFAGEVHRRLRLPFEIDRDQVEAHYADGRLTVTLPRAEADKPARIAVSAG